MNPISPRQVLSQVAEATPPEFRYHVVVVGSLAAAYHFFKDDPEREVRTKDIDCVLEPNSSAAEGAAAIARKLVDVGWRHRVEGNHVGPRPTPQPAADLNAVRLYPPDSKDYFVELHAVPESENDTGRNWIPIHLADGYYGLCTLEFLSLAAYGAELTEFGLRCAHPEMMALANLLSHPTIGTETMSGLIVGRRIKRSNKDLGRVIALAFLAGPAVVESWPGPWQHSLQACFPTRWKELASRSGSGLRSLLESDVDLEEAYFTATVSLLSSHPPTLEQYRIAGDRLVQDAIDPLEGSAR